MKIGEQEGWAVVVEIAEERLRQIKGEGFTEQHDDGYVAGELADAAYAYLSHVSLVRVMTATGAIHDDPEAYATTPPPMCWPWSPGWWKPRDYRRDLVRAAALIIAEIERMDRAAP